MNLNLNFAASLTLFLHNQSIYILVNVTGILLRSAFYLKTSFNINTVFLLINAPGRDAKHNEGASILTLKQQNTVTKNFFFPKYVDCRIFLPFVKARF